MKKAEFKDFPQVMQDYFLYQLAIRNKSELTVLEYASDLRSFLRFLKLKDEFFSKDIIFKEIKINDFPNEKILNVTNKDAISFLSFCNSELKNNAATRSRKASTLRSFYKWLTYHEHLLDTNPMEHLESPKSKKQLPKYLTIDDCFSLLKSIDGPNKERDFCIVIFFLNCGLRLSELVSLNYNDIRSDRSMKVTGKGNKERTIYLNDACIEAFEAYMKVRPNDGLKDKNALFISRNKNRISNKTVQHIIYTLLEKAGLSGMGLSTHKLRHTAATLMYQHGNTDIMLIKEILGHENLGTTQIYTHVVNSQLQQAVNSNPLSQVKQEDSKK
ncbi:MAG: tyrosine recombinase XerC [Clostridia bacterium]|nr:tyrosine recombinase XerC [Clostridia bacterium]